MNFFRILFVVSILLAGIFFGGICLATTIKPDSDATLYGTGMSVDFGVENYPDSKIISENFGTNYVQYDPTILDLTTDYTILSIMVADTNYDTTLTCGDNIVLPQEISNYIASFTGAQNGYSLTTPWVYNSSAQIHCSEPLTANTNSEDALIQIQYVPYDTRTAPTTSGSIASDNPDYYDWLLINMFILFFLSLIALYPVIKSLFPHKKY